MIKGYLKLEGGERFKNCKIYMLRAFRASIFAKKFLNITVHNTIKFCNVKDGIEVPETPAETNYQQSNCS